MAFLPLVLQAQDQEALKKERNFLEEKSALFDEMSKFIIEDYTGVLKSSNKKYDDDENKALNYYLSAHAAYKSKEFAKAIEFINRCLEITPKNEIALELAIDIAYQSQNQSSLENYYKKLYAVKPEDEGLLLSLIEFYDGIGSHKLGEKYASELKQLKGKDREVDFYRARVMLSNNYFTEGADLLYGILNTGFYEPAFSLLYRLENLNKKGANLQRLKDLAPKSYLKSLDFIVLNMPLLIDNEEYSTIISLFDTLSNSDIVYAQHLLDYPSLFLSPEAVSKNKLLFEYFERLELVLGNDDARLALCRGNLALATGQEDLAMDQYLIFAKTPPVQIERVIDLSNYLISSSPKNAFNFLKAFEDYFPGAPILSVQMAKTQLADKNNVEAKTFLDKAQQQFFDFESPEYWEYLKIRAQIYISTKNSKAFIDLLSNNASFFTSGGEYLLFTAFQVKEIFEKPVDAFTAIDEKLKTSKSSNEKLYFYCLKAIVALDLQQGDIAEKALDKAEEINQDNISYILAKAEYYRFAGENNRAIKYYKMAQELDPKFGYIALIIEKLS